MFDVGVTGEGPAVMVFGADMVTKAVERGREVEVIGGLP